MDTVVSACLEAEEGQRRMALVTRLRADARLSPPGVASPRAQGRPPQWGARLAAPQHHLDWSVSWQPGQAWGDGRRRQFRSKQLRCGWAVSGAQMPRPVFVGQRAGDAEPWVLVTSALDLSPAPVVEVFAARVRQEDALREHNQRLGMAECRAWTEEPIWRPWQVPRVALTRLRLLQARLNHAWGPGSWRLTPEWNPGKRQAAILDLRRLCWRYRADVAQFLVALEAWQHLPRPTRQGRPPAGWAA